MANCQEICSTDPSKSRNNDSGKGKSVTVLLPSDVTVRKKTHEVLMPNTIEMAQIKKTGKERFKTGIHFSSKMSEKDVEKTLQDEFNILKNHRFCCASAADNRTKLNFHGEQRVWDGRFIKRNITGNSALYILIQLEETNTSGLTRESGESHQQPIPGPSNQKMIPPGAASVVSRPFNKDLVPNPTSHLKWASEKRNIDSEIAQQESSSQQSHLGLAKRKKRIRLNVVLEQKSQKKSSSTTVTPHSGSTDLQQTENQVLMYQTLGDNTTKSGIFSWQNLLPAVSKGLLGTTPLLGTTGGNSSQQVQHCDKAVAGNIHVGMQVFSQASQQSSNPMEVTVMTPIALQSDLSMSTSTMVQGSPPQHWPIAREHSVEHVATDPREPVPLEKEQQDRTVPNVHCETLKSLSHCSKHDQRSVAQASLKPVSTTSISQQRELTTQTSEHGSPLQQPPPASAAADKKVHAASTKKPSVSERQREILPHERQEFQVLFSASDGETSDSAFGSILDNESNHDTVQSRDTCIVHKITPCKGSTKGGDDFDIILRDILPLEIDSCVACFQNCGTVNLDQTVNPFTLSGRTPKSLQGPGPVNVTLMSSDGSWQGGEAVFEYIDDPLTFEEFLSKVVTDRDMRRDLFNRMDKEMSSIKPSDGQTTDSCGKTASGSSSLSHSKCAWSVELLRLLVYKAAEIGGGEFIQMIFSTSARKVVFNSYKNSATLPEDVARTNGHLTLANYLQDVNSRLSKENNSDAVTESIDWVELKHAVNEEQSLTSGTDEAQILRKSQPPGYPENDDDDERDYFADDEISPSSSPCHSNVFDSENEAQSQSSKDGVASGITHDQRGKEQRDLLDSQDFSDEPTKFQVPQQIQAQGYRAEAAFREAMEKGSVEVYRGRIMIIGQDRAGKTSLKKFLLGIPFDPEEESTVGVKVDSTKFEVEIDQVKNWQVTDHNKLDLSEYGKDIAKITAEYMRALEDESQETTDSMDLEQELKDPSRLHDVIVLPKVEEDAKGFEQSDASPTVDESAPDSNQGSKAEIDPSTNNVQRNGMPADQDVIIDTTAGLTLDDVTENVEQCLQGLELNDDVKAKEIILSVWDFAGQNLYYASHPMFLSHRAAYVLVHNLSKDLSAQAKPYAKHETRKIELENPTNQTNLDNLLSWLASIHCIGRTRDEASEVCEKKEGNCSPYLRPPVFVVGTHADKPFKDIRDTLQYIQDSISGKRYDEHVIRPLYAVDNTRSATDYGVQALQNRILEVLKQEPYMGEKVPIRWFHFEKVVEALVANKIYHLELNELLKYTKRFCHIDKEDELKTMLKFYHDLGVIVKHDRTVVLQALWLIDLFKQLINVRLYDERDPRYSGCWQKLREMGILRMDLVDHVFTDFIQKGLCKQDILKMMEDHGLIVKFPLLPADGDHQQEYFVPSLLKSLPLGLSEIKPSNCDPCPLYLHFLDGFVPHGLFAQLVSRCVVWCSGCSPKIPELYQNGAMFFSIDKQRIFDLALICRKRFIKIILTQNPQALAPSTTYSATKAREVRVFLEGTLKDMSEELSWLCNLRYELCVACTHCLKSPDQCSRHSSIHCGDDDCLHLLQLRPEEQLICWKNFAREPIKIYGLKKWLLVHDKESEERKMVSGNQKGSKNPGLENVTVMSGKTKFLYADRFTREKLLFQLAMDSEMQHKMFEYMHKRISSDLQTSDPSGKALPVPQEIQAQGHRAEAAFIEAMEKGSVEVYRGRIMLIGQDRAGKTSLKKFLLGIPFDPEEESTVGIEVDSTKFEVEIDQVKNWQVTDHNKLDLSEYGKDIAKITAEYMKALEDESQETIDSMDLEQELKDPSRLHDVIVLPKVEDDAEGFEQSDASPTVGESAPDSNQGSKAEIDPSTNNVQRNGMPADQDVIIDTTAGLTLDDVTENVEQCLQGLELNGDVKAKEIILSVWDFAGQNLYYASHPMFLSHRAAYVLVHNLSKDLSAQAKPYAKHETRKIELENPTNQTNLDNLLSWLASIHCIRPTRDEASEVCEKKEGNCSPYLRPPVFVVGTHADKPSKDIRDTLQYIQDSISGKRYDEHVIRPLYAVDNTRSASDYGVQALQNRIYEVLKQEPYIGEKVPIRWFHFEKVVEALVANKIYHMELNELLKHTKRYCHIDKEDELKTMLTFYHDLGVIVKHGRTVVLQALWLIDLFKQLINVRPYDKRDPRYSGCWQELKEKGILTMDLVDHVFTNFIQKDLSKQDILKMMEHRGLIVTFSFLPADGDHQQKYFVPSLCKSLPLGLYEIQPSNCDPCPLYLHFLDGFVPHGLFAQLVSRCIVWCSGCSPEIPELYQNGAMFSFIGEQRTFDLVLICRKRFIKIILTRNPQALAPSTTYSASKAREVRVFLESTLKGMREELSWLRNLRYELCVACTHCLKSPDQCSRHSSVCCADDDCLHLLRLRPEEQLICRKNYVREPIKIYGLEKWLLVHEKESEERKMVSGNQKGPAVKQKRLLPASSAKPPKLAGSDVKQGADSPFTSLKRPQLTPGRPVNRAGSAVKRKSESPGSSCVKHPKPMHAVKEGSPENDDLERLANQIINEWKKLGRRLLESDEALLDALDKDNDKCSEKAYKMLLKWKAAKGSDATFRVLYDALCHDIVDCRNLAETFCLVARD